MKKKRIHRGEMVQKAVFKWGQGITKLADLIDYSRGHIYTFFEKEDLELDIIHRIGKAIGYDFSKDIPDILPENMINEPSAKYDTLGSSDLKKCQQEKLMWERKYYELLEQQNALLQGAVGKLMKSK